MSSIVILIDGFLPLLRDSEALAYLSAILTGFSLLMNFVLQKLGLVLNERELAKLKETTLLKQVDAMCLHYSR